VQPAGRISSQGCSSPLCGASVTIVSGCSSKRQDVRYGCSLHYSRGRGSCSNSLLIARRILEDQLLAGLREKVLQPHVVECTLAQFEAELKRTFAARHGEAEAYRNRESDLERKIGNLTRALADGYSQAITSELARTEAELETIRIHASCTGTLAEQLRNTREFVKARLRDLRALFSAEAVTIRAEIAKHVQKIVLTPEEGFTLLRDPGTCSRGSMDGAGGQNRTGYARLFRAALYQ
jgi:hypothetical protein